MATDNLKGLTIEFGADTTKLSAALSAVERALKVTNKQLNVFKKNLKFDPGSLSSLEGQTEALRRKLAVTAQQAGLMRDAIGKVEGESSEIRRLAEETDNAALAAANARQQYNALIDRLAAYKDELDAAWSRMSGDKRGTFKEFEGEDLRNALELIRYEAERTGDAIAATVDEYEALSPKAKVLQAELEKLNDASGLQDLRANADAADSSIESLVARVRELGRQTDLEKSEAGLRRMDAAAEALNGELSRIDAALRLDPVNVEAVNAKMANLSEQAELARKRTKELEKLLGSLSAKGVDDAGKSASVLAQELEEAESKLQDAAVKVKRAEGELENLEQQMRIVAKIDGPDSDRYRKLASEVDAASGKYRELAARADEARSAADTAQMQSDMRRYRTEIIETTAKMESLGREARELQKHLGVSIPAGTIKQVGITLSSTISPAISMVGSSALQSAEDVDGAFRNMVKTVQGTDEQFEELRQSAIEFSQTNITSTSQLLQIEAMGGQLGIAAESLDEFAQTVSRLDIATNIDADTMAQQLGQLAGITDMAEDDFSKFADALVRLGNNSPTLESNIMDVAMRIGSMGTISGMSVPEILALATAVASTGQGAEAAGTAISNTMSDIETAVANGGESLQGFADVAGMSAEEFKALWQDDALGAIQAFVEGLADMESRNESADQALQNLGINGVRQKQALLGLAQTTDVLADSTTMAKDAWDGISDQWGEAGDAAREADRKAEGFSGSMGILRNNLEVAGAAIGDSLIPFIDMLSAGIQTVTDAFLGLPQPVQTFISALGGVGIAAGPMLTIAGSIGEAWGSVADRLAASGDKVKRSILDNFSIPAADATSASETLADAVGDAGDSVDDLAGKSGKARNSFSKWAAQSKKLSTVLGGLRTVGIALGAALAAVAVTGIVSYFAELAERSNKLKEATDGLREASLELGSAATRAGEEMDAAYEDKPKTLGEITESMDEVLDKHSELAESLKENFSSAGSEIGQLDYWKQTIHDLNGQYLDTSEEQGRFVEAAQKLSEQLGINAEAVQDETGKWWLNVEGMQANIDKIDELIEAKKRQIRQSTFDSASQEASDQAQKDAEAAAEAEKAWREAEKYAQSADAGSDAQAYADTLYKSWKQLEGVADGSAKVSESYASCVQLMAAASADGEDDIRDWMAANDELMSKIPTYGQSATDLADDLLAAGMSQDQFNELMSNGDALDAVLTSYDGTFASIRQILSDYGIALDDATMKTAVQSEAMGVATQLFGDSVSTLPETNQAALDQIVSQWGGSTSQLYALTAQYAGDCLTEGQRASGNLLSGLTSNEGAIIDSALQTKNLTVEQFAALADALGVEGKTGAVGLAQGLIDGDPEITAAVDSLLSNAEFQAASKDWAESGTQIPEGIAEGVNNNGSLTDAINALGEKTISDFNTAMGIASPAQAMVPAGEYIVQGIAQGIRDSTAITDAFAELAARITSEDNPIGRTLGERIAADAATAIGEKTQLVVDAVNAIPAGIGDMTGIGIPLGGQIAQGMVTGVQVGGPAVSVAAAAMATSAGSSAGSQIASAMATGLSGASGAVSDAASSAAQKAADAASSQKGRFSEVGQEHARAWAQEIERFNSKTYGQGLANRALDGARAVSARPAGSEFAQGYIDGINSKGSALYAAAYRMATQAVQAARDAQQSASPSKVMKVVGGQFAEGYALGIERLAWMARDASDESTRRGWPPASCRRASPATTSGRP